MNIRIESTMKATRRGVTLTELLVVLAIIGLLASMAVPTYLSKVELARIRTTQAEVKVLAEAEEVVALQHGYYVPLQMLDDNPSTDNTDRDRDDIWNTRDEIDPLYLIDPAVDADLQRTSGQLTLQQSIIGTTSTFNRRVSDLYNYWDGPFVNFTRVWTGIDFNLNVVEALDDDERARDYPLDPWNNPYRLYSPPGIVGSRADDTDPGDFDDDGFGDGRITTIGDYEFDRYAIVSYGPNGEEGDGSRVDNEDNDDIFYTFGRIPSRAVFRRF